MMRRAPIAGLVIVALAAASEWPAIPARAGVPAADSVAVARTWLADGQYARVEPVARRALARFDAIPGVAADSLADALDLLVESLWRQGFATRPETQALAARALSLRDTSALRCDSSAARALSNAGAVRAQTADLAGARVLLGRALAIRCRWPGRDSLDLAWAINDFSALDLRAGDPAAARVGFQRVLALRMRALGGDHPLVAWSCSNLANALEAGADFVGARRLRERCLAIRRRVLPGDHPDIARGLRDLANDLFALGDARRAIALERQALAVSERSLGANAPEVARNLVAMAATLRGAGDLAGARRAAARALAIREHVFDRDNPEIATSLLELGRVLAASGALAAAEDSVRRALDIRARAFGPGDPVTAIALDELATVLIARGRGDSAVGLCARAIRAKTSGLGPGHPNAARSWRLSAEARRRSGDLAGAARDALECERIAREHLVASMAQLSEADALAYEATRASGLALAARLAARPGAPLAERRRAWDALVRSRARVLDELLAREGGSRAEAGIDDVLSALPSASALVSVLRCEGEPAPLARAGVYVAFVARAGSGEIHVRVLGSVGAIDSLVDRWRRAVLRSDPTPASLAAAGVLGGQLRRRIWDTLQPAIGSARTVLVVNDGALAGVNPYALPAAGGGYLVEGERVVEPLSSERELVRPALAAGSGVLLAVGGVDYGTTAVRLPETAREVDSLAVLWRALPGTTGSGPRRAVVLRGDAATCAALRAASATCEVLHIATHGVFAGSEAGPRRDARGLASGPESVRSVLARSGLLLAHDRGGAPGAGGFLSAADAARLDLRGARWVVLSGCETGAGRALVREGSVGLQRAFKLAGARVVITSLWPVEDRATREWMTALYRARWRGGLSTGAAVRAACLDVLARRRRLGLGDGPATWAGFVSSGLDD